MKLLCLALIGVLGIITPVWSQESADKSAGPSKDRDSQTKESLSHHEAEESEDAPDPDAIGEDCVGFLRATQAIPPNARVTTSCPECPPSKTAIEVLKFDDFKIDRLTNPSKDSCVADVTIRAQFNPSSGGKIFGGLIGWIAPKHRKAYELGKTPFGLQTYKVRVFYRRSHGVWRTVEFGHSAS
jgi:hypothetical protein